MNREKMQSGEKEPAQWELVHENDTRDARDMFQLRSQFHGNAFAPELFDDEEIIREGYLKPGLILRRGGRAIGYCAYKPQDVHEWPNESTSGRMLYIQELYIDAKERSPGVMSKFLKELRAQAENEGAQYIAWAIGSPIMETISKRIEGSFTDLKEVHIVPVSKLDASSLGGRI